MSDFGFAFNDPDFSDRVLHIEIIPDDLCDPTSKNKIQNSDKEHDSESESECFASAQPKMLYLSSPILAEKSPFFYKLFNNGMRETHERHVTLRITAYEQEALMELLKFIYRSTLRATTHADLIDVLIIADKYEVISCIRYCTKKGLEDMSLESALFYLDLPCTVSMIQVVEPLKDAAKQYLAKRYKDISVNGRELMKFPLYVLEIILSSDDLQTDTEDYLFTVIFMWGISNPSECRKTLTKLVAKVVCFPNMSNNELEKVLVYNLFDKQLLSELVNEARFIKFEVPHVQHILPSNHIPAMSSRVYLFKPIKVVPLDQDHHHSSSRCVIYWDINKKDCETKSKLLDSQNFWLGGFGFQLVLSFSSGNVYHYISNNDRVDLNTFTLDVEVAMMEKQSKDFQSKLKYSSTSSNINGSLLVGALLFKTLTLINFIAHDNDYFIDGFLSLRTQITITAKSF